MDEQTDILPDSVHTNKVFHGNVGEVQQSTKWKPHVHTHTLMPTGNNQGKSPARRPSLAHTCGDQTAANTGCTLSCSSLRVPCDTSAILLWFSATSVVLLAETAGELLWFSG